jgi:hypothetical protein
MDKAKARRLAHDILLVLNQATVTGEDIEAVSQDVKALLDGIQAAENLFAESGSSKHWTYE